MTYWLWSVPPDALAAFVRAGTFALRQQGRAALADLRPGDRIFAYVSGRKALAGVVEVVGEPFEDATALVPGRHLPHRIRVRPLTVLPREAWIPSDGFLDHLSALGQYADEPTSARQFRRVVQRVLHVLPAVDGKVLEFLVAARRGDDPDALMAAVEAVRQARSTAPAPPAVALAAEPEATYAPADFDRAGATARVLTHIEAQGFRYEPWQVAAFLTALRTKPFVLLAGITGVGKSRLPQLVAAATGARTALLPVRPDWTDPAETLGYVDLAERFRAGAVLRAARDAMDHPGRYQMLVLDEMNLARPEHYLAEVLSRLEQRAPSPSGPETPPLLSQALAGDDAVWQAVRWTGSLGLVGTVNVDESAHVFSRKVLDRAFTLELAATDLRSWSTDVREHGSAQRWPVSAWWPRALRLSMLRGLSNDESERVDGAVAALAEADAHLRSADLGIGYRSRDEAALFVLHAMETPDVFATRAGEPVDPLDLALLAKVLPRIDGAGAAVTHAAFGLLGWAWDGRAQTPEHDARDLVGVWQEMGRPSHVAQARYPRTAARLARIVAVALDAGVVSFWA